MEPECSLPRLQDPAAGTYPKRYITTNCNTVNNRRNWREYMKVM